jgi:hypothetical protein
VILTLFRSIFGQKKAPSEPSYQYQNILHFMEDDYLMIEIIPEENLNFIKQETQRIQDFGKEHFDGTGFTEVTPIGEKSVKTIEKLIYFSDVEKIMIEVGLDRIQQVMMQWVGLLKGDKAPVGYGTNQYGLMYDLHSNLIKNIYIIGHIKDEDDRKKITNALLKIGESFNFIAVNWWRHEYCTLEKSETIYEFVKNI